MNCTNCNAPLEPNAKFCGECGHLVSEKAVHASSELQCTNCGAGIEPGFEFCGECGHPVSAKPLSSEPIHPEATLIEQFPSPPMAKPPAEVRSTPTREPKEPVAPSPPSAAPTVMAQDVTPPPSPPPQRAAAPPPRMTPQPAAVQHAQEPPKKKMSGCTIVLILLAVVIVCCVGSLAVGWYFINNAEYDFSSSGFDMPFLDQFQEGDLPFLDQFLGQDTQDELFDDFFSDQVGLTLQNSSDIPACFVYISPSVSDDWGDDWLGDDEVISPGDTMIFQLEPNQLVDIYTLDCNGDLLYEEYEIDLSSEDVLIILEPGP